MAEVMLSLELEADQDQRRAFHGGMTRHRWTRVPGLEATWTCYFEGSFIEPVRRIVTDDVYKSAAGAGIDLWRGAHSLSSIETQIDEATTMVRAPPRPASDVWTDAGVTVGPTSEVMLTLALATDAQPRMDRALGARGWRRLDGLRTTWAHTFDLGMYTPLEAIVAGELRAAARGFARVRRWRAAWSLSSCECTLIRSPLPPPAGPYHDWRL